MDEKTLLEECRRLFFDDGETLRLRRPRGSRTAGDDATFAHSAGYRSANILGRSYLAHRLLWLMRNGALPPKHIDHIDGDRTNNGESNLRAVSRQENQRNMKRFASNYSGRTGVSWQKEIAKWRATIRSGGKQVHLGVFDLFSDAAAARSKAEEELGFHENHGRP